DVTGVLWDVDVKREDASCLRNNRERTRQRAPESLGAWLVENVSVFCFESARDSRASPLPSVPRMRAIDVRVLRCASCEAPRIAPTHLPVFPNHPSCLALSTRAASVNVVTHGRRVNNFLHVTRTILESFFSNTLWHPTYAGGSPKPLCDRCDATRDIVYA